MSHPVQPSTAVAARGPLRRYLEARGLVGGFAVPTVPARVQARDGTMLAASYLPGPGGDAVAVLAHGFGANRRKPAYARLAQALATRVPVLSLDLRGHGRSAGRSTFGDVERLDVLGAGDWARGFGHRRVVLVGVSMGATAVVRAAATADGVDGLAAVVTISGPAWFRDRAPQGPLQRLETVWHSPVRRAGLQVGLGVRLDTPAAFTAREHPVESMARVAVPVLVVHGEDDAYFPTADAHALAEAAGHQAVLWRRGPGFGHAEDGFAPGFLAELTDAVEVALATGRFPAAAGS